MEAASAGQAGSCARDQSDPEPVVKTCCGVFRPAGGHSGGLHQQRGLPDEAASGAAEARHHLRPDRLVRGGGGQQ